MTMVTVDSVGLVAHFSPTGDRAFRYALSLAKGQGIQLNIFSFRHSPFMPDDPVAADREVRLWYEDRLGDFLDVGFRVCEGAEEVELRRCLKRREYQALVIPYLSRGVSFGNLPIEEFAFRFTAPVVLVGPWRKVRYWLNPPAVLLAEKLHLFQGTWRPLPPIDTGCRIGGAR